MSLRVSRKPSAKVSREACSADHVGGGVEQQLHRRLRAACFAVLQAEAGREVAAGAVAADGDPRPGRRRARRRSRAPRRRPRPRLRPGREGVLGREPVVDREHPAAAVLGEEAAEAVVGLEVADHPAAAVVVDEQRLRRLGGAERDVEARRHLAARAGDRQLFDPRHRPRRPAVRPAPLRGSRPAPARLFGPRPARSRRCASPARSSTWMSAASSWPSSRGGAPKSRRCVRGSVRRACGRAGARCGGEAEAAPRGSQATRSAG